MTSLITGTWTLVSSSVEIIKSTRRMTLRIRGLLQGGQIELSEGDQRRLVALQKRVACLVQPLNFLILWSKQRDSCVQQVVLSAQELLFDVCSFVERFVPAESGAAAGGPRSGGGGAGGTIDSEKLEYYVRELEFACASVSMAVSVARITEPVLHARQQGGAAGGVSLSALLRASRRIQEMHGRSGDLCTCPGRLFAQGEPSGDGERRWQPLLSLATFKVVAAVDGRTKRRRYRISVESRLPLSQPSGTGHREPVPIVDYIHDEDYCSHGGGLNTSGPLDFQIEVALDASLLTTGCVALPTEQSALEAPVDSLALVWSGARCGEEVPSDVTDAVLVPESLDASPRSFSAGRRSGGRYAFIFDGQRGEAERTGDAEVALTPLDAMYLARLCALDDEHSTPLLPQEGAGSEAAAGCPPHLLSSDEVLAALLTQEDADGCREGGEAQAGGLPGGSILGGLPLRSP